MNVEGVKRGRELESYLTNMKINGYEIVALEQAENSANMQKFKFVFCFSTKLNSMLPK